MLDADPDMVQFRINIAGQPKVGILNSFVFKAVERHLNHAVFEKCIKLMQVNNKKYTFFVNNASEKIHF